MQNLISALETATGLPSGKIAEALGILLGVVKTQGHPTKSLELLQKLEGAEELIARYGTGLAGKLAGGMMGGPLAAISRLQGLGLSMDQIKTVGSALMTHARQNAGDDVVRQAAANIPGLSGYL